MPTYRYKCSECSRDYSEVRDITHSQSFTHCHVCGAEYVLVTE